MIGVEEGRSANALFWSGNQHFFGDFVVFEVGGGMIDGVLVNDDADTGIFCQHIARAEQKVSGIDLDNGLAVFFDIDLR